MEARRGMAAWGVGLVFLILGVNGRPGLLVVGIALIGLGAAVRKRGRR